VSNKVLITGAGGFIGGYLWRYLANLDYQIVACVTAEYCPPWDINASRYVLRLPDPMFERIMRNERPDWLIHCAGSSSVQQSFAQPDQDFVNSVLSTEFLFRTLAAVSPRTKVLFISSGAVYGNPEHLPIDEQTPAHPISVYGFHKRMCELVCQKYAYNAQVPVSILRVFSVYGPGLCKQVLWDIFQKSLNGPVISLYGTGEETRDFIYIDDLAYAVHLAMEHSSFDASVINVASGVSTTIKQLSQLMVEALGGEHTVQFLQQIRPGDPIRWRVNIDRLSSLEMRDSLPIAIGVRRYVDWLQSQMRN
jgi:UDP-glucose 4-epimerase